MYVIKILVLTLLLFVLLWDVQIVENKIEFLFLIKKHSILRDYSIVLRIDSQSE